MRTRTSTRRTRLTLRESVHAFSLKLWDEERGRMVGWGEIGERGHSQPAG